MLILSSNLEHKLQHLEDASASAIEDDAITLCNKDDAITLCDKDDVITLCDEDDAMTLRDEDFQYDSVIPRQVARRDSATALFIETDPLSGKILYEIDKVINPYLVCSLLRHHSRY